MPTTEYHYLSENEKHQLLRLFRYIDRMCRGQANIRLSTNDIINGQTVNNLRTQIDILSRSHVFNCSGPFATHTAADVEGFYIINLNGQLTSQWRKLATEVLGDT